MGLENVKFVQGQDEVHICTGTLAGDLQDGFPFSILDVEHAEDFSMHGHEYSELNIVLSGSATHVTDYEDYQIEAGDVFVITGENQHGFRDCKNLRLAIVQFDPEELKEHLSELNKLMGYHGLFDIEARSPQKMTYRQRFRLETDDFLCCQNIFNSLKTEFEEQTSGYKTVIRGLFVQLVCYLSRYYEKANANDDRFAVSMANVVSHICKHYRTAIRIEDLAEISGLSVSQMQRRFKLIYNTTPVKMMNVLRTEEAVRLLEESDLDLNEIAQQIGYSAASFFSTQFKQMRGMTPREYRKKFKGDQRTKHINKAVNGAVTMMLVFLGSVFMLAHDLEANEKIPATDLLFLRKIKPLLTQKCFGCHGEDKKKIKADYNMLTREGMLKGGESGNAAIIPGDAGNSPIMEALKRLDEDTAMPPKESNKLSAAQVGWFEDWINAGANWPDDSILENDKSFVKVSSSGALSKDWADRRYDIDSIWAYQPIIDHQIPKAGQDHAIDNFLEAKAKALNVKTAEAASKEKLIRRAWLDLTGLNPTFDEIQAFLKDQSPKAFETAIDKLLASQHYGEQMARMWLDVTRYADTSGYANDFERPNAWRYRDYVIRSFNKDKPFDQFAMEQIAGDEMGSNDPDKMIATGFLRMGAWEHTGMSVIEVTRQLFLDDVTESVGKTFLAQPIGCAKCHDHKFDPIPTKDYYRIQAVFATTQFAERKLPFTKEENIKRKAFNDQLAYEKTKLNKNKLDQLKDHKDFKTYQRIVGKQRTYFNLELQRFEPYAFAVYNGENREYKSGKADYRVPLKKPSTLPQTAILTGGSIESPAETVSPGVLSAMYASNDVVKRTSFNAVPDSLSGRRLAFAKWLTHSDNTMTARVIVNRIWQQHFSHGLVKTPNSFGVAGSQPTHPQLLDHLASWFIKNGWSIKKLHKYVMMSKAYQMSNDHSQLDDLKTKDPDNKLLRYFPARRLQAEMIYDSLLKMTGELNTEMGGPGIFPEINWEITKQSRLIMGTLAPLVQPSPKKSDRNRRQLYAFVRRSVADPLMEVFNKPGSELSCARRDETTVTPQAFSLFNSEYVHNRALALANRITKKHKTIKAQISEAFKSVYGRLPNTKELKLANSHLQKMKGEHDLKVPQKIELPKEIKGQMIAELSGEPVFWDQVFNVAKHYERDLMPWDVNAETRALTELCLVLINSNEFLYIY